MWVPFWGFQVHWHFSSTSTHKCSQVFRSQAHVLLHFHKGNTGLKEFLTQKLTKYPWKHISSLFFVRQQMSASKNEGTKSSFLSNGNNYQGWCLETQLYLWNQIREWDWYFRANTNAWWEVLPKSWLQCAAVLFGHTWAHTLWDLLCHLQHFIRFPKVSVVPYELLFHRWPRFFTGFSLSVRMKTFISTQWWGVYRKRYVVTCYEEYIKYHWGKKLKTKSLSLQVTGILITVFNG